VSQPKRRHAVVTLSRMVLRELLEGTSRCVDFPKGARIKAMQVALARDGIQVLLESEDFAEVDHEGLAPEIFLMFERLKT